MCVLIGSYFHILGHPNCRRVIRCIALPLLPHGRIEEAFQAIQLYAQAVNKIPDVQVRLSVVQFLKYIRNFWLDRVGAQRLSVHN